jgi:hypothetical protein
MQKNRSNKKEIFLAREWVEKEVPSSQVGKTK